MFNTVMIAINPNQLKRSITLSSRLPVFVLTVVLFFANNFVAYSSEATKVFVDLDTGIDDAVALAFLAKDPSITLLGATTVSGNTTVENATVNTLNVLERAGRSDVEVTMGASGPLVAGEYNFAKLVHGPDGFWSTQTPRDISGIATDAAKAIADAARNNPDMTLLILGPATNVANAVQQYPEVMQGIRMVMVAGLDGSETTGQFMPGGFNAKYDPHAVEVILNTQGVKLAIFSFEVKTSALVDAGWYTKQLRVHGGDLGSYLSGPVGVYLDLLTPGFDGGVPIFDANAVAIATNRDFIRSMESGLGRISTNSDFTEGHFAFRSDFNGKIFLIAGRNAFSDIADQAFTDPNFDLENVLAGLVSNQTDNMEVITGIHEQKVLDYVTNFKLLAR